jgi:penicillin G amidase
VFPDAAGDLDPPIVSAGGDNETVQATGWEVGFGIQHGSVARYVFDLADWDRSLWVIPLGTSGDRASPHYADQAEAWSRVDSFPMTYSWDRIESGARSRQSLEPT